MVLEYSLNLLRKDDEWILNGKKVFVVNRTVDVAGGKQQECLRTFNLSTPFDLTTAGIVQDDGDPLENLASQSGNDRLCEDINFNNDGTKMFLANSNGELFQFNLASPFDLKGCLLYTSDAADE